MSAPKLEPTLDSDSRYWTRCLRNDLGDKRDDANLMSGTLVAKVKQRVEKSTIAVDAPGQVEVLLGNEAIAHGIVGAGAQVATAK